MRAFISILLVIVFTVCCLIPNAQAKRFGGGRSIGMQRSVSSFNRTASPSRFTQESRQSLMSRGWLGPLAGFALGGLLASLFMGHGLGTGIMSWMMIGGLAMLLFSLFRNRQYATSRSNYYPGESNQHNFMNSSTQTSAQNQFSNTSSYYPPSFDADSFLRAAKVQFMRLQAAYDQKNLEDIRSFTTPEVFAEIQLQFQERNNAENITEVQTLEAELLDTSFETSGTVACVRFSGMIAENKQPAAPFKEVWHFLQNDSGSKWLVAGVQQE